jgi:hypothetical protein
MAKHKFMVALNDERGAVIGAQCIRCGQIALYENGRVPDDITAQDCKKEDASQAAARIVREATEDH